MNASSTGKDVGISKNNGHSCHGYDPDGVEKTKNIASILIKYTAVNYTQKIEETRTTTTTTSYQQQETNEHPGRMNTPPSPGLGSSTPLVTPNSIVMERRTSVCNNVNNKSGGKMEIAETKTG